MSTPGVVRLYSIGERRLRENKTSECAMVAFYFLTFARLLPA